MGKTSAPGAEVDSGADWNPSPSATAHSRASRKKTPDAPRILSVSMSQPNVDTVFIVGAGFSHHAGLPLTSGFTQAILEARELGSGNRHLIRSSGASRTIVSFLTRFIHHTFDLSLNAGARSWPELEDIFTCVDLSANSGHHLGSAFAPAELRTVRRALLSRIIRMLDEKYLAARRKKSPDWKMLEDFFVLIELRNVGFISMNWDTVIERRLNATQPGDFLPDYCCDALPAKVPELAESDELPPGEERPTGRLWRRD